MPVLTIDDIIEEANRLAEVDLAIESDENRLAPYNEMDADDDQRNTDLENYWASLCQY